MPFFNRDSVGARNIHILRYLVSDKRPESLVRVCSSGKAEMKTFE